MGTDGEMSESGLRVSDAIGTEFPAFDEEGEGGLGGADRGE